MKNTAIFIIAMVVAGAAGYGLQQMISSDTPMPRQQKSDVIGTKRPEFAMMDIHGQLRNIKDFDGQVVLLNFWATWCPPCLKEIPDFIEVQEEFADKGFQIVGVAVENEEDVKHFAEEMGMNYPVMAGEMEAIELARRYGNSMGALPFSAIIDKSGTITHTFTGELSKSRLKAILKDLDIG